MLNKKYMFEMLEDEYWYGGIVDDGSKYPLNKDSFYECDLEEVNQSSNQAMPLFISNKGRYIWSNSGFKSIVGNGKIEIFSKSEEPKIYKAGESLRDSFLDLSEKILKPNGIVPPKDFFLKPQYNTWIELLYNQNQIDILNYAKNIVKNKMPAGIIMIDDGWSDYYGRWMFNKEKFPNPKEMISELHELGFKVMLWTCPFITPDTIEFRELDKKGFLIRLKNGDVSIKHWWNGYSAVLDLTNPDAVKWYNEQNKNLMDLYGVDGFKFDAGDARFYNEEDITFKKITPNEQCELWAKIGLDYEYNEYRACFKMAGKHLVQRLADKNHSWKENGLESLIPNQLTQGLVGYSYGCPDMIGGGEYLNFLENSDSLDEELFVRYAQCASLMPMMQFSAAPWRVLSKDNLKLCVQAALKHGDYAGYIYELAKNASMTGEPITRMMEYNFPNQGLENVKHQFMLGDKYIVAPVIEKGQQYKEIFLPKGKWRSTDGALDVELEKTEKIIMKVSIETLIIIEKLD